MFNWSVSMLEHFIKNPDFFYASMIVASLNMLIQILFSMMFGDKSVLRIGGKR